MPYHVTESESEGAITDPLKNYCYYFCTLSIVQLIADWRRLLQLESKNGPLPGTKAKRPQLLERLEEVSLNFPIDLPTKFDNGYR